jgi:hypothetical protein
MIGCSTVALLLQLDRERTFCAVRLWRSLIAIHGCPGGLRAQAELGEAGAR